MRRVGLGVVGALCAVVLTIGLLPFGAPHSPLAAPVATAAGNDIVAVVVDGTGHGHGRGMSQWGAYGYAVDEGKSWQWILDHYFGGTKNTTVPAGQRIRVRLLAFDGQGTVGVVSHGAPIRWNGTTRTSMYATETSPGVFDVYGSSARSCPGAAALTVPD
ncbi:MAG: hypothetical protein HKN44_03550, partial [Ilumatobacter sp.]|nr:hypothetical protein [Ilumatobacter sp.]